MHDGSMAAARRKGDGKDGEGKIEGEQKENARGNGRKARGICTRAAPESLSRAARADFSYVYIYTYFINSQCELI